MATKRTTRKPSLSAEAAEALAKAKKRPLGSAYWKPEKEGDYLVGTVLTRDTHTGKFGDQEVVTIDSEQDAAPVRLALSTVLLSEWEAQKIALGDRIVVVYRGLSGKKKKGQNPAKLFAIEVISRGEQQSPRKKRSGER